MVVAETKLISFAKNSKLNSAQQFIVFCSAVSAMSLRASINILKYNYPKQYIKKQLYRSWGIADREAALDTLFGLIADPEILKEVVQSLDINQDNFLFDDALYEIPNHRNDYLKVRDILSLPKEKRRQAAHDINLEYRFVRGFERSLEKYQSNIILIDKKLPDHILAWDYCRAIDVIRACYTCNYLSEKEAWALARPIARKLQKTYTSWKDLMEGYFCGRAMWGGLKHYDPAHVDAYHKLLDDPYSPQKEILWNTNLNNI